MCAVRVIASASFPVSRGFVCGLDLFGCCGCLFWLCTWCKRVPGLLFGHLLLFPSCSCQFSNYTRHCPNRKVVLRISLRDTTA